MLFRSAALRNVVRKTIPLSGSSNPGVMYQSVYTPKAEGFIIRETFKKISDNEVQRTISACYFDDLNTFLEQYPMSSKPVKRGRPPKSMIEPAV